MARAERHGLYLFHNCYNAVDFFGQIWDNMRSGVFPQKERRLKE